MFYRWNGLFFFFFEKKGNNLQQRERRVPMDTAVLPSITHRSSPFRFIFDNTRRIPYLFPRPARPPPHIHISNQKPQLLIAVNCQGRSSSRLAAAMGIAGSTSRPSKHVPCPRSNSLVIRFLYHLVHFFCYYDILTPLTIQGWFFITSQGFFLNRLVMPHLVSILGID